jgi:eukaryotic-like serine/threonine-protein kinase
LAAKVDEMSIALERLAAAVADRYRIVRELGQGGMATVYLAEDIKHDRKVALKVLKPELAAVLGAERFVIEIKTTAALQHPHILPLFDSGTADGFLYYVMPFIDGETLRSKLDRETQLGIDEAVKIAINVADALDYAHRNGVIHRDIKPENILLHDGRPMVADFGIALAVSAAAGGRITETGLSLGTPHYMSPEQATAEKEVTSRSDVYSLGSVLYEMLTGSPPHTGASAQQIIMKIVTEEAAPVTKLRRAVPPNVAAAVAKSLEKIPADRFASAKAFAEALTNPAFTAGEHLSGGRGAGPGIAGRRIFVGLAAITVIAVATAMWGRLSPPPEAGAVRYWVTLADSGSDALRFHDLALAPDGRTIVFSQTTNGHQQLWLKTPEQASASPLTGTADGMAPTFSPDGEWVAFLADGKLRKVRRAGGDVTTLATEVSPNSASVAWLDDGTLLFSGPQSGLYSVDEDGGSVRVVISRDSLPNHLFSIAGVPGGRVALIVTCASNCQGAQLWAVDLASGARSELAKNVVRAWSLTGGLVAFAEKSGRVFIAPFDAKARAFRSVPAPVLDGVRRFGGGNFAMALSRNGTLLYEPAVEGMPAQAVWVTREGRVTPVDSAWSIPASSDLSLSPDGRRVAVAIESGSSSDIWIKELDKGAITRLTFDDDAQWPTWTDGGRSVLYSSQPAAVGKGLFQLKRRRADGTDSAETLLRTNRDLSGIWPLRDTMQLLLRFGAPPTRDIYLATRGAVGKESSVVALLASDKHEEVAMTLSPDERWLAYASDESGRFEVYVRPFPGVSSGRWQVSLSGGRAPRWAPSGRELFFRNLTNDLVAVPVSQGASLVLGERRTLFRLDGFPLNPMQTGYDVAPDGRFLYLRQNGTGNSAPSTTVILVQNWLVEVRPRMKGQR